MTKKIILMIICLFFIISCGKKADPEYKAKTNNFLISRI